MPFPYTQRAIDEISEKDIEKFAKLLTTKGLLPPLPKRDLQDKYRKQPQSVIDYLISTFGDKGWYHFSTDKNGWQKWLYDTAKLDDKICLYTKKLGHILNKLAEFNDNELTEHFVERIAEQLQKTSEETSELLQKFHIFTKTPSPNIKQFEAIEKLFEEIQQDYNSCFFQGSSAYVSYYSSEVCIAPKGYPYVTIPDGVIVINIQSNNYLYIIEHDMQIQNKLTIIKRKKRDERHSGLQGCGINFYAFYSRSGHYDIDRHEEIEKIHSVHIVSGDKNELLEEIKNLMTELRPPEALVSDPFVDNHPFKRPRL